MEKRPEINYLYGHEIADAAARRMARDAANLNTRLQQTVDSMQQTFNTFADSTNAALQKIPDIVNSMRHYVTPQDFGAVGDGVTDDTAAMQAALDSGHDIYIPSMKREKYLITDTLNVTSFNQLIFADSDYLNWASTNTTTEGTDGGFVFRTDETDKPLFLISGGMVCLSNIHCIAANRNKGCAVRFEKEDDPTNVDGSIIRCFFKNFKTAVSHAGRGLAVKDSFFYYCETDVYISIVADNRWMTDGSDTPVYQSHPRHAGRGYRIEGNRHHLTQGSMYVFSGATVAHDGTSYTYGVKGALISNNTCDLGLGYFIRFNCPVYDSIISDNHINRCSADNIIQGTHEMQRTVIANNTFSGLIEGELEYCPTHVLYVKAFDECSFMNNICTNIKGKCVATHYSGHTNYTTISGNVFTNTGYDSTITANADRAAVAMSDATGVVITSNVFNVSEPFDGCAVSRMAVSAKTWTDVTIQDNYVPNSNTPILIPTGAAAVRVNVQGDTEKALVPDVLTRSEVLETTYSDTLEINSETELAKYQKYPSEVEDGGLQFYRVSETPLASDEIIGTVFSFLDAGIDTVTITDVDNSIEGVSMGFSETMGPIPWIISVSADGTDWDGLTLDRGVYIIPANSVKFVKPFIPVQTVKPELMPETGLFVVNISTNEDGTNAADKNYSEILEAINSGKQVQALSDTGDMVIYLPLTTRITALGIEAISFGSLIPLMGSYYYLEAWINKDGSVTVTNTDINSAT